MKREEIISVLAELYKITGFRVSLHGSDYSEIAAYPEQKRKFCQMIHQDPDALRAADMQFGILPFPKYDEDQEDYYAHTYDGLSSFGIPASAQNPEMCARILDAMAAENKTSVIPAYNEIVLDNRVAQDGDSKEMLGIIIEDCDLPVVVDAGIGRPSQACEAMEMGAAACLVNTGIASSADPVAMGRAFRQAVEAGRAAFLAGHGAVQSGHAVASSPLTGFLR